MPDTDKANSSSLNKLARNISMVFDKVEKFAVVFLLIGIVVMIFSGVLSRYVFHYSIAFTEELSRFFFLWGALLGASSAFRTGEHSGIPLLANRFSPLGQKLVEIMVALGVTGFMVYLVIMTSSSTMQSYSSGQISTTTEIPVWWINFGMMIAFAVGVVRCIQGFFLGAFKPDSKLTTDELLKE
jgi:C4-dicarboxylate transporter DctQ subunit